MESDAADDLLAVAGAGIYEDVGFGEGLEGAGVEGGGAWGGGDGDGGCGYGGSVGGDEEG